MMILLRVRRILMKSKVLKTEGKTLVSFGEHVSKLAMIICD